MKSLKTATSALTAVANLTSFEDMLTTLEQNFPTTVAAADVLLAKFGENYVTDAAKTVSHSCEIQQTASNLYTLMYVYETLFIGYHSTTYIQQQGNTISLVHDQLQEGVGLGVASDDLRGRHIDCGINVLSPDTWQLMPFLRNYYQHNQETMDRILAYLKQLAADYNPAILSEQQKITAFAEHSDYVSAVLKLIGFAIYPHPTLITARRNLSNNGTKIRYPARGVIITSDH